MRDSKLNFPKAVSIAVDEELFQRTENIELFAQHANSYLFGKKQTTTG
jgi:hypothetical protein